MIAAVMILAAICFVIWRMDTDRRAKRERDTIFAKLELHEHQITEMQDAIAASPFVTYPYVYSNSTSKKP